MMRNIVDNMANKNEMEEMMEKMIKMNNDVIELVRNMKEKQRKYMIN